MRTQCWDTKVSVLKDLYSTLLMSPRDALPCTICVACFLILPAFWQEAKLNLYKQSKRQQMTSALRANTAPLERFHSVETTGCGVCSVLNSAELSGPCSLCILNRSVGCIFIWVTEVECSALRTFMPSTLCWQLLHKCRSPICRSAKKPHQNLSVLTCVNKPGTLQLHSSLQFLFLEELSSRYPTSNKNSRYRALYCDLDLLLFLVYRL